MINKTINGYTIKRPLGEGGMAEVWYAENKIGNPAAIKFLKKKFCEDENVVARFENEAMVMVKLSHTYIRRVYDYDKVDGRPCILMEYLEGDDLKARLLKGERFSDDRLQKWWDQLADALNYTHQQGIIHRDIKPSNIFIDKHDNVKLMDFGIAKIEEYGGHTQTGVAMGTRIYMSPEQVRDPKRVKAATDSYSLAVTFVHLLTGKVPYDTTNSSDFDIQTAIVTEPLGLSALSTEWRNFLQPYLAKKPEDRPELREFTTTTASPKKGKPTSDDETFLESAAPPKPKVPKQPKKEQPQVSKEDKKSKNLMWTMGLMMLIFTVSIWCAWCFIGSYYMLSIFSISILVLFLTVNIAFIKQFKHKKSKAIIKCSAYILLMIQLVICYADSGLCVRNYSWGMLYWPVLTTAIVVEVSVFAKLFGRIKWINIILSAAYWVFLFIIALSYQGETLALVIIGLITAVCMIIMFRYLKKLENSDSELEDGETQRNFMRWTIGMISAVSVIVVLFVIFQEIKPYYTTNVEKNGDGDYEISIGNVNFTMKCVMGGTFTMGCTSEQDDDGIDDCGDDEKPSHQVTLSNYWIGETEVTQVLWKAVMHSVPTGWDRWNSYDGKGNDYPAYNISWDDCQEFIRKLNQLTGKTFRLPTEAEWEYAARGGNKSRGYKYAGSNNINDVAWCGENGDYKIHTVKTQQPNELGLYDMSGNVNEWCSDWYGNYSSTSQTDPSGPSTGSLRVLRGGGSWGSTDSQCSVSSRDSNLPSENYKVCGLRLVLVQQ